MTNPNRMHAPIAVVGIAAELPSGTWSKMNLNYKSFFEFLLQKRESYEQIPTERFNIHTLRGDALGHIITDTGAFLKEIERFDYLEFGVTSKDARLMPLSTRKLIETTFVSLIDSGIDYRGKNIGCYMAGVAHDMFSVSGHDDAEARGSFACAPAMIANRVSYHLDLRGPSVPIDTACSSSLYATHLAVQALRAGECEAAVVGGCQLNHRFTEWLTYTQGGILSADGKCKPFDAQADGFGRSEGVVSIVLKPLDAALRDNDKIYATILGTGVNSSGSLAPVNAPVAAAQQDAMLRAFAQTGRLPRDVDYVELHATGTAQGDPTEANWVGARFKRDGELLIGSVKGNIGHLEITAFLASICKVCSIFESGLIPPNVNFNCPNPAIKWHEYQLRVPTKVEPLRCRSASGCPLVAMTSSGIGGANGHCVIEGPPSAARIPTTFWRADITAVPSLLIASGLSPRSATAVGDDLKALVPGHNLRFLSRTYGRRARSMIWRSFAVAMDGALSKFSEPVLTPKNEPTMVFVFSGQGTQYFDMGRELFGACTAFRESILELDEIYRAAVGQSLIEFTGLFNTSSVADSLGATWPIAITLPALTMLQLALVDMLASLGVHPDVVMGHSAGETAMLSASGAGSKAMALELAIARGKAMSYAEDAKGTMAALSCSSDKAQKIIDEVAKELGEGLIEIGCFNTPTAVTLSGLETHIDLAVAKAQASHIFARKLRTRVPVHSAMMDLCQVEYHRLVGDVFARYDVGRPIVETYSTKTGTFLDVAFDAQYFWDNTRGPVLFTDAMQAAVAAHPNATFLEIGPHPVLMSYITSMAGKSATVAYPVRRPKPTEGSVEVFELMQCLGKLTAAGHNCVQFDILCGTEDDDADLSLPPFPFARKEVPYLASTAEVARQRQHRNGPLNYPQLQINVKMFPGLADHVINGEPIMPAAGFIEMALEFGARKLFNVEFISILPLSSDRPIPVEVKLEGPRWSVHSASSTDFTKTWPIKYNRLHATGLLTMTSDVGDRPLHLDLETIRNRLVPLDMNGFYDGFSSFAQYGPMYQRAVACSRGIDERGHIEMLVQVRGNSGDISNISDYRFHPALLDAALHILVHPVLTGNRDKALYYLPAKVGAIDIHQTMLEKPFPKTFFAHATFSRWSPESLSYNFTIVDDEGSVLCQIKELEAALHGHRMMKVERRFEVSYSRTGLSVGSRRDPVTEIPEIADPSISRSDADDVFRQEPYRPRSGTNTTDSGYSTSSGVICQAISPQLSNTSSVHVIEYVRGKEMEIREMVIKLDPTADLFIWFFASAGLDGDACLGFTRSLRREYQSWTVRVAVFDLAWTPAERSHAMQDLIAHPDCELEMFVDRTGFISVPRIVLAAPPSNRVPFDATLPWQYDGSELKQISKPAIPDEHILVRVTSATKNAELWAFCGVADGFSKPVIGITDGGLSNIVVAHRGSLVELETTWDACQADIHGPPVLAAAIAVLAVGIASFSHPERLRKSFILVTHSDTEPGSHIVQLYSHLSLRVSTLSSSIDTADLERLYAQRPSIIVSGATDVSQWQVLQDLLPRHGKLFLWNHPECGIANLLTTDPWSVGDALRCALHCSAVVAEPFRPPLQLLDIPQVETVLATDVFDHQKSYLLVGGIGSLGLQIALWMYENGAREIVLTSRSGPESLVKREEFIARRLLTYLEGLPDLTLRAEAVDAQSKEEMAALVGHLDRPLGGCMLLSAVLNDRTFASQTIETFEAPFGPKVGAFEVLEHVVAVESLDFLITFSSVSGMFGNAGQTNYASANTALSGLTRKYKNAMSLVAPVILDSGILLGSDVVQNARLRHLSNWGMTARDLCDYIEDGIRKLREGPVWQYIPDFDWRLVHANMGPSTMYDHLLPAPEADLPKDHANTTTDSIRRTVCKVLDMKSEDLSSEVPLTAYGLDSLSAASLSHALRPLIAVSQFQLLADLTLRQLESRLEADRDIETDSSQTTDRSDDVAQAHIRDMVALVDKYASDIHYREPVQLHDTTAPVILVTGTTGSLGAHVLARLLQSPTPRKIYAFLRKGKDYNPAMDRQIQAFKSRGLSFPVLTLDRLVVVEGTLHESSMGLSPSLWDELRESVTHIVHLGWPVDFGTSLASFEPAIQGLRNLVNLASRSNNRPPAKIIFGSSSGIFRNLDSTQPAQETAIHDPAVAVDSGYSESKWVAERLLSVAVERHAIHATIVRIGQLTGGVNGAWKTSEWIPSLISASAALGCLPEGSGVVSWLPVDTAAAALVDMLDSPRPIVHLRHPRPVPWSAMMQHFASSLRVPLVPYGQWLARLEEGWADARARDRRYLEHAVRLQDFFRSARAGAGAGAPGLENNGLSVLMAMDAGVGVSETLRDPALPLLGAAEVEKWMGYWREIGFLPA